MVKEKLNFLRIPDRVNIFQVKSTNKYYMLELSDIKNNTIRFTDDWDQVKWGKYRKATHILVTNTDTRDQFIREIRNKTEYKNIAIITWRPK